MKLALHFLPVMAVSALVASTPVSAVRAQAQQPVCPPLKQVAKIKMERNETGQWLVPVTINGATKLLLLDIASARSHIALVAMREMKLPQVDENGKDRSADFYPYPATVDDFALGNVHIPKARFPIDDEIVAGTPYGPAGIAGRLGLDALSKFDIDLDFAAGMLNLFSTDHCDGKVVYWDTSAAVALPFAYDPNGTIRFDTMLDGMPLSTGMDTVAVQTVALQMSNAKPSLTIDEKAQNVEVLADAEDGAKAYRVRFKTLELQGLQIQNPLFVVKELTIRRGIRPVGAAIIKLSPPSPPLVPLLLGLDSLNKLHIYVATKEKKLYISPASPPSPSP